MSELPEYMEATIPPLSADGGTEAQAVMQLNRRPVFSQEEGEAAWTPPSPGEANPSSPTPQGNLWAS